MRVFVLFFFLLGFSYFAQAQVKPSTSTKPPIQNIGSGKNFGVGTAPSELWGKRYKRGDSQTGYTYLVFSADGKSVQGYHGTANNDIDCGSASLIQTADGLQAKFDKAPAFNAVITIKSNGEATDVYKKILVILDDDFDTSKNAGSEIMERY